jgi:hypothetical protein
MTMSASRSVVAYCLTCLSNRPLRGLNFLNSMMSLAPPDIRHHTVNGSLPWSHGTSNYDGMCGRIRALNIVPANGICLSIERIKRQRARLRSYRVSFDNWCGSGAGLEQPTCTIGVSHTNQISEGEVRRGERELGRRATSSYSMI